MKWTDNAPTKEGFYFVERIGQLSGSRYLSVCHVYITDKWTGKMLASCEGDNFELSDPSFIRFSTRILSPDEELQGG